MERLIADLLESEALNTRHAILRREPVDPGQLIESVVDIDFADRNDDIQVLIVGNRPQISLDVTRRLYCCANR